MRQLALLVLFLMNVFANAEVIKPRDSVHSSHGSFEALTEKMEKVEFFYTVRDNAWTTTAHSTNGKAEFVMRKGFDIEYISKWQFAEVEEGVVFSVETDAALKCQELGAMEFKTTKNQQTGFQMQLETKIEQKTWLPTYGWEIESRFACVVTIRGNN